MRHFYGFWGTGEQSHLRLRNNGLAVLISGGHRTCVKLGGWGVYLPIYGVVRMCGLMYLLALKLLCFVKMIIKSNILCVSGPRYMDGVGCEMSGRTSVP